ncbi:max dimerization protein 1-like [Antedon mediterranea]|uniref:max dimerization protein 1-like n=1 Tax=Antedon mediterranea TaxID=105859 RepID=UPI003AF7D3EF
MASMINVSQLLQAAEFLERREKEHGYASTLPRNHHENIKRKMKSKRNYNTSSRSTHNELEKNRRAHLRTCLEKLKEIVPLQSESSRHTTLGLLTNAKAFIRDLEEEDKCLITAKEQLKQKQYHLMKRIGKFNDCGESIRKPRQDSTGSCLSSSSDSEKDDIDVIGYNSDSDDQMSGSDGGLVVNSSELRIVQHLS